MLQTGESCCCWDVEKSRGALSRRTRVSGVATAGHSELVANWSMPGLGSRPHTPAPRVFVGAAKKSQSLLVREYRVGRFWLKIKEGRMGGGNASPAQRRVKG